MTPLMFTAKPSPLENLQVAVCHLFDAITLAGFLASDKISPGTFGSHDNQSDRSVNTFIAQAVTKHYQSRAPPTLLL